MTNIQQPASLTNTLSADAISGLLAGVLVLLGGALQLGEFGYTHLRPENLWMFSVIAPGLWNTLVVRLNAPFWQEVQRFWPLILVGIGFALFLIGRRGDRFDGATGSRKGETHV